MSRREDIDNDIWDDPDFAALSRNATLLYLWSWTNPRCGMAGLYKVRLASMTDSKVPAEEIPDTLAELAEAGFAFYEDNVLWVRSRVKYLRSRSETMAVSIAKDIEKLAASHPLRKRFLAKYGADPWLRDALSKVNLESTHQEPIEDPSEKPLGKGNSDTPSGPPSGVPGLGQGQGQGPSRNNKAEELPEDYPRELLPHLDLVYRALSDLARRHNAKAVSRLSLASVLMATPHKPLVAEARLFVSWADSQGQARKDVVAGYRNWLKKADVLAGVERLPGEGAVVPMRQPESVRRANQFEDYYPSGQAS